MHLLENEATRLKLFYFVFKIIKLRSYVSFPQLVDEWFEFLKSVFREDPDTCVAVHCVAGLGRAPVMVALALIELGLKYEDAVELIRQ